MMAHHRRTPWYTVAVGQAEVAVKQVRMQSLPMRGAVVGVVAQVTTAEETLPLVLLALVEAVVALLGSRSMVSEGLADQAQVAGVSSYHHFDRPNLKCLAYRRIRSMPLSTW